MQKLFLNHLISRRNRRLLTGIVALIGVALLFNNCSSGFHSASSMASSPIGNLSLSLYTGCTAANDGATSGPDASLVFSYPNGFPVADQSNFSGGPDAFNWSGETAQVTSGLVGQHEAGFFWDKTKLNIQAFTTDFTIQITPPGYGMTFVIQNDPRGTMTGADSNGIGYFAYSSNQPGTAIANSIGVTFNATPDSATSGYVIGPNPSVTGLYIDGGPFINNGIIPVNDMTPQGINLQSGDVMDAHVTYDGTILNMVLTDTKTGAKAQFNWPVNIPAVVGGNTAFVGFGAGTIPAVVQSVNSWSWWQGINPRLACPTYSVASGSYANSQTVAINAPTGSTIYYTTNGMPPTTESNVYSGPIVVTSSEYLQAIAVENNKTNSLISSANYSIGGTGLPIDFSNGFGSADGFVQTAGVAAVNGANLQLTDGVNQGEIGSAFYVAPVNVKAFTTNFTLKFNGSNTHNGLMFVIQNQTPLSNDTTSQVVSGGPYTFGQGGYQFGFQGIANSVGIKFDPWDGNTTGIYLDGVSPTSSNTPISNISFSSGDPIACTLSYNGAILSLSMLDTKTNSTFSTTWPVDIPATVSGQTAYVGFTASTYDSLTIQDVTNWTFQN